MACSSSLLITPSLSASKARNAWNNKQSYSHTSQLSLTKKRHKHSVPSENSCRKVHNVKSNVVAWKRRCHIDNFINVWWVCTDWGASIQMDYGLIRHFQNGDRSTMNVYAGRGSFAIYEIYTFSPAELSSERGEKEVLTNSTQPTALPSTKSPVSYCAAHARRREKMARRRKWRPKVHQAWRDHRSSSRFLSLLLTAAIVPTCPNHLLVCSPLPLSLSLSLSLWPGLMHSKVWLC